MLASLVVSLSIATLHVSGVDSADLSSTPPVFPRSLVAEKWGQHQ